MRRGSSRIALTAGSFLLLAAGGLLLDRLFPPDLSRLADLSVLVEDKDGQVLRAFTAKDGSWRLPVRLAEVDPRLTRMLLAYEDKRFESHSGVDPLALVRALGQLAAAGHVVSGASPVFATASVIGVPAQDLPPVSAGCWRWRRAGASASRPARPLRFW